MAILSAQKTTEDYQTRGDGFHMSCEEIRFKHEKRGVSIDVLSQLNACSSDIIKRILNGEDYQWTRKPNKKKNTKSNDDYVIVNASDGRIYSSMRQLEGAEGIGHGTMSYRFRNGDGKATEVNGKKYKLYKKSLVKTSGYIVVNTSEGIFYPSIRAAERGEHKALGIYYRRYGKRFVYKGVEYHIYDKRQNANEE